MRKKKTQLQIPRKNIDASGNPIKNPKKQVEYASVNTKEQVTYVISGKLSHDK